MESLKKRGVSAALSFVMAFAMLPATALAAENAPEENPELAAAEERLAEAQKNYDDLVSRKAALDQGAAEAEAEIAYWKEQVEASEAERKEAMDQLKAYSTEKRTLQQKARALNSQASSLTRSLGKRQLTEQETARYEELTAQLVELDRLIAETPDAVDEIAALAGEVKANSAELSKLMEKKLAADAISTQLDTCRAQQAEVQERLDEIAAAENALRTSADEQVAAAKAGLAEAKRKLSALDGYGDIVKQIWDAKVELAKAQAAYDALK